MIQLCVYTQTEELQTTLDLSNPGSISLNYEVGKAGDVTGRFSPFSQSFTLPFTDTNNKFFRQFYDVNNQTYKTFNNVEGFNPDFKTTAVIKVDGLPIITGSLQLTKCDARNKTYTVVVYGSETGLFREIEDKKLVDAFREGNSIDDDYNVNISDQNIIDSWDDSNDVTMGSVGNGVIMFPLIDYGFVGEYNFLYAEINGIWESGILTDNFLKAYHFKPAIRLRNLFELIINKAGYELVNNSFLSSNTWAKIYMTLGTDRESLATTAFTQSVVGNTASTTIETWSSSDDTNGIFQEVLFPTQSGTNTASTNPPLFYDTTNYWNSAGNFIPPFQGSFIGKVTMTFDTKNASSTQGAEIQIRVLNPQGGQVFSSEVVLAEGGDGLGDPILTTIEFPFQINCQAGSVVSFEARCSLQDTFTVHLISANTFCEILNSSSIYGIADIPNNMPDITQKDFLVDLITRFNLAIVSEGADSNKLMVMPWQDYIQLGERKDWTHKVDFSKPFDIKPTTNFKKKIIKFADAEDTDNRNAEILETYGKVFGTYEQNIKGDYIKGELKNEPIFSPFHVNRVPREDNTNITDVPGLLIHQSYKQGTEGPLASCKPKLFYYNGLKSVAPNKLFVGNEYDFDYPLCLPYLNNGDQMAEDSPMLYWSFQTPQSFGTQIMGSTPSSKGYWSSYWQTFLMDIYSSDARILECSIMLSATDIHNFKFNDEIVIENAAYRILNIKGYQPNSDVPTKVTLIKKIFALDSLQIPDSEICTATPNAFFANGQVSFWDGYTNTSVVSEECCIEYGYYWDGTNCYWQTEGGGGGQGDPTVGLGGAGVPTDTNPNNPVAGIGITKGVSGFLSLKSGNVPNVNPVIGEHGIKGTNITAATNTVVKNFVYYATTLNAIPLAATPDGTPLVRSAIQITTDTTARITVRALSVQTQTYAGGTNDYGATAFKVYQFVVKNVEGTVSIVGSNNVSDFDVEDAAASGRSVSLQLVSGKSGFAGNRGVEILCTGIANAQIAWHLDVEVTYMDFGYNAILDLLLLTEDMEYIITEDGFYLAQEK